jgi:hypothetical protein
MTGRNPESELLLSLASAALPQASRARAAALIRAGVRWDVVRDAAESHGLTLLLHRHLTSALSHLCPPGFLDALSARARARLGLNLILAGELTILIPELEMAGCRPVAFKGPALALDVYGDLWSRFFDDIDIVVDRADAWRARELLVSRGYATEYRVDPRWNEAWLRPMHQQPFVRPETPLVVDLHWELSERRYSDAMALDEVRPRLVRVRVGPAEVQTLGPEDNLLFLCCHGIRHNWERLIWLVDVAELLRARPQLDWEHVLRWSHAPGRRRPIQVGLNLAHRLLEAPVPSAVLAEGDRDPAVGELVRLVTEAFFDPSSAASRQGLWAEVVRSIRFRGMERWADRLRYVHESVVMPRPDDWESVELPGWAAPGYYGVHLIRMLRKHGMAAFGFPKRAGRACGRTSPSLGKTPLP